MEISIKDKTITLKKTFRSFIIYESATGKPFAPKTLTDTITYFYCVVVSSDQSLDLPFDEFLEWLDEHDTALQEFTEWLMKVNEMESNLTKKKTNKTKKDK